MAKSPPTEKRSGSEDSGTMKKSKKRRKSKSVQSSEDFFHDELSDDDMEYDEEEIYEADDGEPDEESSQLDEDQRSVERKSNLRARMRARRMSHAERPGDREVLTSKTILMLFGSAVVLLLVAVIVYAVIGRNAAQVDFDQAKSSYEDYKYSQAIDEFNQFSQNYPRSEFRDEAIFLRDRAKIEQNIMGGASNWEKGLEFVNEFIQTNRDREGYADYKVDLLGFSERIARNALKVAETTQNRDGLKVANDAKLLAIQLGAESVFENLYRNLHRIAIVAIRRQETYDGTKKNIQAALDAKDPLKAIRLRLDLLQHFTKFKKDKIQTLAKFLQDSLDLEKSLTKAEDLSQDAISKDRPERTTNSLSITLHRRPQDDTEPLKNRVVIAISDNCCYGIDPLIGNPVWRRSIGYATPFFPIEVQAREPALLAFDTHFNEFLLLKRLTGEVIWRQPLKDAEGNPQKIRGTPLVHDGQILITSNTNALIRISLDTGRVMGRWQCSQNLVGPPVFQVDNTKFVIAGEASFIYTLTAATLECENVFYTGHREGSLSVPLTAIGNLTILSENDRNDSASLRVFNTSGIGEWMKELTPEDPQNRVRLAGQIRHHPVLRNKELYVMTGNERIFTFSVSDDLRPSQTEQQSQPYLVPGPNFPERTSNYTGPEFIVAGSNRQFWWFGSRLSKFELRSGSVKVFPEESAFGIAWHRPQVMSDFLFLARKVPYSTGVIFTQTDRQEMKGNWRIIIGSPIQGMISTVDGPLICVNDAGEVFRIRENDFADRKFFTERNARVTIAPKLSQPLRIFPIDDRHVGVVTQGEKSQLSIINSLGLVESRHQLREPLEVTPVKIDQGLVLAMSGKLRLQRIDGQFARVGDFEPAYDQTKQGIRWKQLLALDGSQIVAVDSLGTIFRVQMQQNAGQNYLAAVRQRKLERPIHHGMASSGAHLFLADIDGILIDINTVGLTEQGRIVLQTPVSNDLWVDEKSKLLFAEVGSEELHCFSFDPNLKELWKYSLKDDSGLAGKPLVFENTIVIVKRNGEIIALDSQTGTVKNSIHLHEPLNGVPTKYRNRWMVPSVDGSLHTIDLDQLLQK